jgi:ribokinase
MRKPIVVVGSINQDLVGTADRVPLPGETVSGTNFAMFHGGKGANQAVGVARLGWPVHMIAKVGDDAFGPPLKRALKSAGVNVRGVKTVKGSSGVALINIGGDGQNSILGIPGANWKMQPADVTKNAALLRRAGTFLTQLEIPLPVIETLAVFANRENIPLILDPAPARELPSGLLRDTTWITPNESETRILCGLSPNEPITPETATGCAEMLLERGTENVIIKMGAQGCLVATRDGQRWNVPAFRVQAVDSTAAGDAFNAGFAVSLLAGRAAQEAARYASAAAAISVTRRGAQPSMPKGTDVARFLEQQKAS